MFPRVLSRGIIARTTVRMFATPPINKNNNNSINSKESNIVNKPSTPAAPSAASAALTKALLAWRSTSNKAVATKHFQEALRLEKLSPEPDIAALARVHGAMHAIYELDDYDSAAAQMDGAMQILKDKVVSRRTRVTVSWQIAQFAHRFSANWRIAEVHYAAATHYDTSNPAIFIDFARMFIDRGGGMSDYSSAVTRLNSVLARWPENTAALTWLGFVHDQVSISYGAVVRSGQGSRWTVLQVYRDGERAEAYYERALKSAPDDLLLLQMFSDFMRESRNNEARADELSAHAQQLIRRQLAPSKQ
jgi:tetratricopeptide (TPR) repeat protein